MRSREVKAGDYYMLPFKGSDAQLLVQAVRPGPAGHWYVHSPARPSNHERYVLLSSCRRVTPQRAESIIVEAQRSHTSGVKGKNND